MIRKKIYDNFICDTVFVVKYKIKMMRTMNSRKFYDLVVEQLKKQSASEIVIERFTKLVKWYYRLTIKFLPDKVFTLYIGASIDDIYSFAPCKEINEIDSDTGFEKPDISNVLKEYFPHVKRNEKGFGNQLINYKEANIKELWDKIKECIIKRHKLELGELE